jgi:hypothetical protein
VRPRGRTRQPHLVRAPSRASDGPRLIKPSVGTTRNQTSHACGCRERGSQLTSQRRLQGPLLRIRTLPMGCRRLAASARCPGSRRRNSLPRGLLAPRPASDRTPKNAKQGDPRAVLPIRNVSRRVPTPRGRWGPVQCDGLLWVSAPVESLDKGLPPPTVPRRRRSCRGAAADTRAPNAWPPSPAPTPRAEPAGQAPGAGPPPRRPAR